MSTWRMVREASTRGLSVVTAPLKVRPRSVAESAAGVALDARLVRLHQAAVPAPAGPERLQARMRVAARGDGGEASTTRLQVGHGGLQGGDARFEVVGGALGRRGAEL